MQKRLLATLAALAAAALTMSAAPAFSGDNDGTVAVTITAAAPEEPCIEFATPPGVNVDFGTKQFSRLNAPVSGVAAVTPTFRNCSATANEHVLIAGTDATGAGALWTLDPSRSSCASGSPLNTYQLQYWLDSGPLQDITKTPTSLIGSAAPSVDHVLTLAMWMPCHGSDGAGQTLSASIVLTATVA